MNRYIEAVKADVRRRMGPPHRKSVAEISQQLGIHVITLYKWRKAWRLQGEVVPSSHKDPEGWSAADKFTVMLETAGFNATELSAYCRERGLYPEQVERWRQASQDANEKPVLTLRQQKELEKLRAQDQREIKRLQKELRKKEKALAEAAVLLLVTKKDAGPLGRGRGGLTSAADRRRALEILDGVVAAGATAAQGRSAWHQPAHPAALETPVCG
jgi:transposase-like protein